MCHGENRYGFFVEFDITNFCHLQLAFLEFYPFKEVKYVKSLSFTEFTPTLFYLLSHKLLILNNLQILALTQVYQIEGLTNVRRPYKAYESEVIDRNMHKLTTSYNKD